MHYQSKFQSPHTVQQTLNDRMDNNNDNKNINTKNYFNVKSIWSKAGVGTCIILETSSPKSSSSTSKKRPKQPRIVLDIGATPNINETISSKYILISHGHMDHIGAIGCHARSHNLIYNGSCATYFVPIEIVSKVKHLIDVMCDLDNHGIVENDDSDSNGIVVKKTMNVNIIGIKPGDEIELNHYKNYFKGDGIFLRAFAVNHGNTPALGYTICRRETPTKPKSKLKPEYVSLASIEIRDLIQQGINVKMEEEDESSSTNKKDDKVIIEVGYTGDTNIFGLLANHDWNVEDENSNNTTDDPDSTTATITTANNNKIKQESYMYLNEAITKSNILFCEFTFLDTTTTQTQAIQRGHLHIHDIKSILSSHGIDYTVPLQTQHQQLSSDDNAIAKQPKRNIIFYHLSSRYRVEQVLNAMISHFPTVFLDYCEVAIRSFMTDENYDCYEEFITCYGCISLRKYANHKLNT